MSQCPKYPCRCLKSIRRYLKCRLLYSARRTYGRACVCWPACPLPTTCLWYDMTYTISGICFHPIRTTTGFKKSYNCRKSLRQLPIPTYIRSADFYQAGVLIRACACADQHACPSQNQSSAADLKKILINIESLTVILGFMCQRTSWKKQKNKSHFLECQCYIRIPFLI